MVSQNKDALLGRAKMLYAQKRFTEALQLIKTCLRQFPEVEEILAFKDVIQTKLKQNLLNEPARSDIQLEVSRTRTHFDISDAMTINIVRDNYDKLIVMNPKFMTPHILKGNLCLRLGEYPSAEKAYEAAIEIDSESVVAYSNLAVINICKGNQYVADAKINKALKFNYTKDPATTVSLLNIAAHTYMLLSNFQKAKDVSNDALKIDPENKQIIANMYAIMLCAKDYVGAEGIYTQYYSLIKDEASTNHNSALFYIDKNDYQKALSHINKAISLTNGSLNNYLLNSYILAQLNDLKGAQLCLDYVLNNGHNNSHVQNAKGFLLYKRGSFQEALTYFKKSTKLDEDMLIGYLNTGITYQTLKMGKEARESFEKCIVRHPHNEEGLISRALSFYEDHLYLNALVDLNKVISKTPFKVVITQLKMDVLIAMGSLDEAILLCTNLPDKYSSDITTLYLLALAYERKCQYQKSLDILQNVVERKPDCTKAYLLICENLIHLKRYNEALERGLIINTIDSHNATNLYLMAVAYRRLNKCTEALVYITNSLSIDENSINSYIEKSRIERHLCQLPDALKSVGKALELDPKNYDSITEKGLVLLAFGNIIEAIKSFERAISIKSSRRDGYYHLATAYIQSGQNELAVIKLNSAIQKNKSYYKAYVTKAIILNTLNRPDTALESLAIAINLKPHKSAAFAAKAVVLQNMRRFSEALDIIEIALEKEDVTEDVLCIKGNILGVQNRLDEASACYNEVLAKDDKNVGGTVGSVKILIFKNELDKALEICERCLLYNKGVQILHILKGDIFMRLADYENAEKSYTNALGIKKTPEILNMKAKAMIRLKDYVMAKDLVNGAINLNPLLIDAYATMGFAEYKLKNPELGNKYIHKALTHDPNNSEYNYINAKITAHLGLYNDALSSLERSANLGFDGAHITALRGKVYLKSTRVEDALQCFIDAYNIDTEKASFRLSYNAAMACVIQGKFSDSIGILQSMQAKGGIKQAMVEGLLFLSNGYQKYMKIPDAKTTEIMVKALKAFNNKMYASLLEKLETLCQESI
jgi:tetratricopeptide (TPR) repeat protein